MHSQSPILTCKKQAASRFRNFAEPISYQITYFLITTVTTTCNILSLTFLIHKESLFTFLLRSRPCTDVHGLDRSKIVNKLSLGIKKVNWLSWGLNKQDSEYSLSCSRTGMYILVWGMYIKGVESVGKRYWLKQGIFILFPGLKKLLERLSSRRVSG